MPLVRVELRNEYALGLPELYTETDREDPKAVLDGVAAAGLIGILRQLGDLAEFAVEIFHGLQEQVLITSSRSHKLVERVHNIESSLPPLEKAILGQNSHLHFAYTSGSKWHTQIETEQNHFIYSDLPCCIMDSYEACHDPPRLHYLDKFDTGGPGSCFKRYSDPTFFKRSSVEHYKVHLQSIPREKKKNRSSSRCRDVTHGIALDVDRLTYFDLRNGSVSQSEDNNVNLDSYLDSPSVDDNFNNSYLAEDSGSKSNLITWDEKLEIIDSIGEPNEPTKIPCTTEKMDTEVMKDLESKVVDHVDFDLHNKVELESPEPSWSTTSGQTIVNHPVKFWSNGGMLGLEPSKPPDFGFPAVVEHPGQQNIISDIKSESSSKITPKTELTVPENDSVNSSRMFKFHNRLKGFRKQISLIGNETFASSMRSDFPGKKSVQKGNQTVTKEQFTSFISPSSPPLEHLDLSFTPIYGFETSKLKLKFLVGNDDGSNGVMFPSFQLVPDPAMMLHEFASDTDDDDDDTFCRSSPYASDDCRSNCSESNSEHWDSSESNRINDHISSAESVSTSLVYGIRFQQGFTEYKNFEHQSSFDNQSFNSIKVSQSKIPNDLNGSTQPPPPLPPIEWRGIKPVKQNNVETNRLTPKHNQPNWENNLHVQNGSIRTLNEKGEEKDDFLHQIRTTRRNLRPISTAQPTTPAGSTSTAVKVTAIFEKANTIEQVVGIDDVEVEGNWSDS